MKQCPKPFWKHIYPLISKIKLQHDFSYIQEISWPVMDAIQTGLKQFFLENPFHGTTFPGFFQIVSKILLTHYKFPWEFKLYCLVYNFLAFTFYLIWNTDIVFSSPFSRLQSYIFVTGINFLCYLSGDLYTKEGPQK